MTLRCAIYSRHSTDKSKTENQRPEVEKQIARAREYDVVSTFRW
jgi:DNA invertase Pin-like site-specific DNA recombinase